MYAKMSFYDTTPIGRLVNRFSSGKIQGSLTKENDFAFN